MGVKLMSTSGSSTRLEYWTNPVWLSELRMTKIRLDNFTASMRYYTEEEECQLCGGSTAEFPPLELKSRHLNVPRLPVAKFEMMMVMMTQNGAIAIALPCPLSDELRK